MHKPQHDNVSDPDTISPARRLRSIFSGSAGNLVEWYDWLAYSAFAIYFAPHFFPKGDTTTELLNSAAVFAVGFLVRPLGGWLMGMVADRYGRKTALIWSVVLMCGGSLLIAIAPGYEQIGLGAPIILVVARLIQGLSLGGEYGTSATYLSEMADRNHRGFWSSFQYVSMILGQLLAMALLIVLQNFLLTEQQLEDWGWRIPFAIGAALGLVVMFLRRSMEETQSYTTAKAKGQVQQTGLRELMKYPREVATVVGLTLGGTVAYYTYTSYTQKFLVNSAGFDKEAATLVAAISLVVFLFMQPLMGALSDRIGRKPLLIGFGVMGTLFSYTILSHIATATSSGTALIWVIAGLAITSLYTSINAIVKAELFPAHIRALGVGLPYAVTLALFSGTAEYIALWFKKIGHENWFYWYVTACAAISLLVYITMRETKDHSRIDRD